MTNYNTRTGKNSGNTKENPASSTANADGNGFTSSDRQIINQLLTKVTKLETSVSSMKATLKKASDLIVDQTKIINDLHCKINTANYRHDSLEQYGRRESIRIHGVSDEEDAEKLIEEIAAEIEKKTAENADGDHTQSAVQIGLNTYNDIQRCHFIGTDRKKVICRFRSYKTRMKFLQNKRIINGTKEGRFGKLFIAEDLTQMRSRLVWYIKEKFSEKFSNVHTRNGTIKMKITANNDNKWVSVNNPDDLFKHLDDENDFDIDEFNDGLYSFKILPQLPLPQALYHLEEDASEEES